MRSVLPGGPKSGIQMRPGWWIYRPVVSQVPPGSVNVSSVTAALQVVVVARDELLCRQRVMQLAGRRYANTIGSHACIKQESRCR